jgi:hypothetical protein
LARFAGVYDLSPAFSMTIEIAGDELTVRGTGQPAISQMYLGTKDGHPRFFNAQVGAEIEFIPDANGTITSVILHQGGQNLPGKKR